MSTNINNEGILVLYQNCCLNNVNNENNINSNIVENETLNSTTMNNDTDEMDITGDENTDEDL